MYSQKIDIPSFWIPCKVQRGDTLNGLASRYKFGNPGPILAFNADHLPGAILDRGASRTINPAFAEASRTSNRTAALLGVKGAKDFRSVPLFKPLASNQINEAALSWDHAGCQHGDMITVASRYPIDAPLDPVAVPMLEIPWTRPALAEFVSRLQRLRSQIIDHVYVKLGRADSALGQIQRTFFVLDMLSSIMKASAELVKLAGKAATIEKGGATLNDVHLSAKKIIKDRAKDSGDFVRGAANLARDKIPAQRELPELLKLEKGVGFWIENTVGWLSPSKIAAIFGAISERDSDILWWGPEAIDVRTKNKIIAGAEVRVKRIDVMARWANAALRRSFYNHVVYPPTPTKL